MDWRLICVVCLAAIAIASVGYLEARAWTKATQLSKAALAQSSQRQLSVAMRESAMRIHTSLFRYQLTGEAPDEDAFHRELRQFSELILKSRTAESSTASNLISRIDAEFQQMTARLDALEPVKGIRRNTPSVIGALLDKELEPLRALIEQLADAEKQLGAALDDATLRTINDLRFALRMSVVALAVLVASAVLLMYHGALVPLRVKLGQTEAVWERHEKLASLGVLATGVAHEIRNPLTAIKFRLFSLKKSYGDGLAENEDFQTIRSEIDRLEKIVQTFLEFARPPEPKLVSVSSTDLLQDLERLLGPEMANRKVGLVIDAGESISFTADKQQLAQVLINLTQNAADSMPGGGDVTIRARQGAAILSRKSEPVLLLEVIDNGLGISPEVQARLFDPFFSTKEGGTGLGLAIAARIVERHGGLMQFASRQGQGATFTVVLPIIQKND